MTYVEPGPFPRDAHDNTAAQVGTNLASVERRAQNESRSIGPPLTDVRRILFYLKKAAYIGMVRLNVWRTFRIVGVGTGLLLQNPWPLLAVEGKLTYFLSDSSPEQYRSLVEQKAEEAPPIALTRETLPAYATRVHPVRLDPGTENRLRSLPARSPTFIPLSRVGGPGSSAEKQTSVAEGSIREPSTGVTIQVTPDGTYRITTQGPDWTFGGTLGHPLRNIQTSRETDGIGVYQKITFDYDVGGAPRRSSIRTYVGKSIVMFGTTFLESGNNGDLFPRMSVYPKGLHSMSFRGGWNYQFGPVGQGADSPWSYFDDSGNTFILSAASHFLVAQTSLGEDGSLMTGIHGEIATLPAAFTQETMLTIGKGINATWDRWGRAMTDLQHKIRPGNEADITLQTLGYWTDAVATYYYDYDASLGYEGTLKAVKDDFARNGIPLNYLQVDSWWYPKGNPPSWRKNEEGLYQFTPDAEILPNGLSGLQTQVDGIPLVAHGRWLDPASPLRQQYTISGNVSTDPKFWKDLAAYFKSNGVTTYEQDWLSSLAHTALNLSDPEAFLDNMASAMAAAGLSLQYCSPTVGDFLQGSKYGNLTTIRASNDGFNRTRWDSFLYNARLASALGEWPFADNVYSSDRMSLVLATLSAGPVGVGDAIGTESAANLRQTVRSDGVLVKPDVPIVPMDQTYLADAKAQSEGRTPPPMLASTYSDHGGLITGYVFAYSRSDGRAKRRIEFSPSEAGVAGTAYVYNYFTGKGQQVDSGSSFIDSVNAQGSYYIVAPVGSSGIALLGDTNKFVTAGKQRITQLEENGSLSSSVLFAAGELSTTVQGYSLVRPTRLTASAGNATLTSYNDTTHLFTITLTPDASSHEARFSLTSH